MPYDLNRIYDCTSGKCHLCHKRLAFRNYGAFGAKGAWDVDHLVPRSLGGTDHPNNLRAACIPCNRYVKNNRRSNSAVRMLNGVSRAPLGVIRRAQVKDRNVAVGAVAGMVAGAALGPLGALIGAFVGGSLGSKQNPDR
jgi:hypothetical protein